MNPPSLREICAKAVESRSPLKGHIILMPAHPLTQEEAALAARFSPATALAVYEALEGVLRVADRKTDEFDAVRRALALLDGRTEP